MKLLLALVAVVAAVEDDKKKEVKENAKCVMGKDECNYEADQKLICAQGDFSGWTPSDEQKKKMKDGKEVSDADFDKMVEKVKESRKVDGDNGNCIKSEECDKPSADVQEYVDAGAVLTCSAKA